MNKPKAEQLTPPTAEVQLLRAESRIVRAEAKARDAEAEAERAELRAIRAESKLQKILNTPILRLAFAIRRIKDHLFRKLHIHGIKSRVSRLLSKIKNISTRLHIIQPSTDKFDIFFFRNSEILTKELQQKERDRKLSGISYLMYTSVPNGHPAIAPEDILNRIRKSGF